MGLRLRRFSNAVASTELHGCPSLRLRRKIFRSAETGDPAFALSIQKDEVMPDLSSQIGTLYRVIGQSNAASGSQHRRYSHTGAEAGMAALDSALSRGGTGRWICSIYCLWFSLPLSIWLSSGWIGLLLYWQVLSGATCLLEKLTGKQRPAMAGMDTIYGDAPCSDRREPSQPVRLCTLRPIP